MFPELPVMKHEIKCVHLTLLTILYSATAVIHNVNRWSIDFLCSVHVLRWLVASEINNSRFMSWWCVLLQHYEAKDEYKCDCSGQVRSVNLRVSCEQVK